jgi:hypothetical protein
MGPVNWAAVFMAAGLGVVVAFLWHGPVFRADRRITPGKTEKRGNIVTLLAVMLLAAIMLGHSYARIGTETLAAKPWLYFMQSGGLALFFVCPAVWLTHARSGNEPVRRIVDALFWVVAYLGMGLVFWAVG